MLIIIVKRFALIKVESFPMPPGGGGGGGGGGSNARANDLPFNDPKCVSGWGGVGYVRSYSAPHSPYFHSVQKQRCEHTTIIICMCLKYGMC